MIMYILLKITWCGSDDCYKYVGDNQYAGKEINAYCNKALCNQICMPSCCMSVHVCVSVFKKTSLLPEGTYNSQSLKSG